MQYPEILVIPGKDLKVIKELLKNINVNYKVRKQHFPEKKTYFQIGGYIWPNKPFIYLDDIYVGLQLPFFKPEPVELKWDIANCIPHDWTFDDWEFQTLDEDIKLWSSFNFKITDKIFINNIVNKCIHQENEILRIYTETLKPTFLHPDIQTLLDFCVLHKKAHIKMWCYIKEKLVLANQSPGFIKTRIPEKIFLLLNVNITELIAKEEILEPAATECLTHFTTKGHLCQFIKMVQRRDKESKENAKLVKILLDEFKKMYPFMIRSIDYNFKCQREYVTYINDRLKISQFISPAFDGELYKLFSYNCKLNK